MNDDHCTYVSYLNFVKGLSFDDLLILAKRLVMLNASMVRNRWSFNVVIKDVKIPKEEGKMVILRHFLNLNNFMVK